MKIIRLIKEKGVFFSLFVFCFCIRSMKFQYAADSFKYEEVMAKEKEILKAELEEHPDVETKLYPERTLIDIDFYV